MATKDLMALAFASMEELCSSLSPGDWSKPTDCPGWTVQDQLSHQCGIESSLLGRPAPEGPARGTERDVDHRRSWPPQKVLDEYRELTAERIPRLHETPEERLAIRVFDCWMHEQDIRNAIGRPGNLEGPVARFVYGRCVMTMPMIVGKRVAPPDGTTVVFDVDGDVTALGIENGRAKLLERAPEEPTVRLVMDMHALERLAGGRRPPAELDVRVEGDDELGRRVLDSMTFTP
jgi:uncharacterized protein (TIGR03083 family)